MPCTSERLWTIQVWSCLDSQWMSLGAALPLENLCSCVRITTLLTGGLWADEARSETFHVGFSKSRRGFGGPRQSSLARGVYYRRRSRTNHAEERKFCLDSVIRSDLSLRDRRAIRCLVLPFLVCSARLTLWRLCPRCRSGQVAASSETSGPTLIGL
jgi:hypothetical protein